MRNRWAISDEQRKQTSPAIDAVVLWTCPRCKSRPGVLCVTREGNPVPVSDTHMARMEKSLPGYHQERTIEENGGGGE